MVVTEHMEEWFLAHRRTRQGAHHVRHGVRDGKVDRWWDYVDIGQLLGRRPPVVARAHHGRLRLTPAEGVGEPEDGVDGDGVDDELQVGRARGTERSELLGDLHLRATDRLDGADAVVTHQRP